MRGRLALKRTGFVVAAVAAGAVVAGPAFADGTWGPSSITSIVPGFDTRNWDDPNNDSVKTAFSIKNCFQDSGNDFTSLQWQLRRNHTGRPDDNLGNHNFSCKTSTWQTVAWDDMSAGSYHFMYVLANGGQDYYFSTNPSSVKGAY